MSLTTSSATSIIGEPEVVEDGRSLDQQPAWLALKTAATSLHDLQAQDGSIPDGGDHERARALVDDQEIVRIAKARSNEMLASTQAKADALRRASSQFCDEALRRTEEAISAALGSVQQAHAAFQNVAGSTAAPAAAPAARQPEIRFEGEEAPEEETN